MTDEYVDISFTIKDSELRGRRYVRNLRTGQFEWRGGFEDVPPDVIVESSEEPVEPLPTASVEQPSADPAPPLVDLLSLREKQLDEAFKPLGAKIDAKVLAPPTKSVAKRKKVQRGA